MDGEDIVGIDFSVGLTIRSLVGTENVERTSVEAGTEDRSGVLESHVSRHLLEGVCLLGFFDANFVYHKLVDRCVLIFFLLCHGCLVVKFINTFLNVKTGAKLRIFFELCKY